MSLITRISISRLPSQLQTLARISKFERMTKTHTRLLVCAGWSVSMLVACKTNRLSHDEAIENILSLITAD